ncbi:MAG: hypothetical protein WAX77_11955 [Methylococcaceae bacterium]
MLFFAKVAGIAVLVWFYLTAKNNNQSAIQWAIIGVIGYWITWWLVKLTVVAVLTPLVAKSFAGTVAVVQIPALVALAAAFFIRKKLLSDITTKGKDEL